MNAPTRPRLLPRLVLALTTLALAVGLLALVAPRLQASLAYLPVDAAIKRYYREGSLSTVQLPALKARAEAAIAHYPHYRYRDGLSFLHYLEVIALDGKPWLQRPALYRSLREGQAAVERAPAKPRTWLRIARTRSALEADGASVAAALKLSFLTGRVEPTLMLPRLELGYRHLPQLDAETRALLRDQTLLGWRMDPRAFRRAIAEGRLDLQRVVRLLGPEAQPIVRTMEGTG